MRWSCSVCFWSSVFDRVCRVQQFSLTCLHSAADVKSVQNRRQVEQTQERVNRALMEHTQQTHPGHSDKFGQLLLRLPEVRSISLQVEEYLYQRHLLGDLPCNSLLTEMLHTKHGWGVCSEMHLHIDFLFLFFYFSSLQPRSALVVWWLLSMAARRSAKCVQLRRSCVRNQVVLPPEVPNNNNSITNPQRENGCFGCL